MGACGTNGHVLGRFTGAAAALAKRSETMMGTTARIERATRTRSSLNISNYLLAHAFFVDSP
jgi:hypothetical protein